MTRIAINVCLTNRRRQSVRKAVSLDGSGKPGGLEGPGDRGESMASGLPDHREPDAQSRVGKGEELDRLERAMARLEPDQRTILILRDGQDMDYADIASVLEVPQGTVKSRLFRARMALRQQIEHLESGARPDRAPKGGERQ
jgi:RNA polymerase sigma-70 factor (ECF subfamily)